jgi:hypothetical protein
LDLAFIYLAPIRSVNRPTTLEDFDELTGQDALAPTQFQSWSWEI